MLFILCILLAAVFIVAGCAKLFQFESFRMTLRELEFPTFIVRSGSLIPLLEITGGVFILVNRTRLIGAWILLLLISGFVVAYFRSMKIKKIIQCNCFGGIIPETFGPFTGIKIFLLLVLNLLILYNEHSFSWEVFPKINAFYSLLMIAGFVVCFLLGTYLIQSKSKAGQTDSGLELGTLFPRMNLVSVTGKLFSLFPEESAKHSIVLITSPSCNVCRELFTEIHAIRSQYENIQFIPMLSGDDLAIKDTIEKYNIGSPVGQLIDQDLEQFKVSTFPFAYLLSPEGVILSKNVISCKQDLNKLVRSSA